MKLLKYFSLFILLILSFVVFFYFWGKQSNYQKEAYSYFWSNNVQNVSSSDTLNIMTYNIGYLSGMTNNLAVERPKNLIEENLQKSIGLIKRINPDIMGFQEIDFASERSFFINQFDSIFKSVGFYSGAMAVNWDKKYVPFPYWPFKFHFGEMYSGQALLSNFNILENDRIVLPKPDSNPFYYNDFYLDRLAQISWLKFQDTKILIINVHFEAWEGNTREIQASMVLDFYRKYCADYPVLIMGDFNCNPPFSLNAFKESTIQQFIDQPGLEMCLNKQSFSDMPLNHYTFSSLNPYHKIDYIFYNSDFFNCIESRVVNEANQISDHLPVYAKLLYKSK